MTIIEVNKKYYTIPTKWNELSQQQLLQVMDALFVRQYSVEQGQLKLLKILCNMNYWQFFRTKPMEMEEFIYLTDFLLNEKTELTKNIIPVYKGMYGPASNFDNLVMKEMTICDNIFMQWAENREDISLLNDFCSLLYRPGKEGYDFEMNPDGDARILFNQNISEWYGRTEIAKWPMSVKLAIVYWYDACRQELVQQYDEVFGSDGSGDVSKYGLASMMMSVAEGGVLGDFSSVENHYVKTVLMQMDESIRKAKAQEKAMKV